ncbi:vanadium-dependent haloperoxidase (plasmid) [Adhaeribacter swui]|uniref:Vanadium-dependent haloperoxidase n=1 Tax=Adhaeribacter swui TaxID=2086471 RepID=A0A7G7G209_9BACT|nr:vanadium-dependent haloperoxidase [Adhaeribacter swui]QNF31193.1 vanadium-dependent haloperoxidase [Adhaeribacter swui]
MFKPFILLTVFLGMVNIKSCEPTSPGEYKTKADAPELFHKTAGQLTQFIIHDIFKPPVASRIYVYTNLAAYETLRQQYPAYETMAGKLKGFKKVPSPEKGLEYCFPLASIASYITVSKALIISASEMEKYEQEIYQQYEQMGTPEEVMSRSIAYGQQVAQHILAFANQDNYKETRALMRYTFTQEPGSYQPTPPNYANACEPQWNAMRVLTLDTCNQFKPKVPAKYSLDTSSEFYKMTRQVYNISKNLTEEQKAIAYFWDDNAVVTNVKGHVSYMDKKMTPPGHWLAIVQTLAKNQQLDLMKSLQAYTFTSIALYDGFIACWDEKYRSARIRPITVINNMIDPEWQPFLETPPFPEYVSGHSAISAAAGTVLTHLLGNNVAFTDSTEYAYGHGVRSFKSIKEAYMETSLSRVYGGIHFWDGSFEGTRQGEQVGEWVWSKLSEQQENKNNIVAGK